MNVMTNIDDVRARIMELESAAVFDQRAWALVLMALSDRPSARADAARRMATAKQNQMALVSVSADCAPKIKLEQNYSGHRIWNVDGKRVETWSDYDRCLRCGHKLTSPFSRVRGYGQECSSKKMWHDGPIALIVVATETEVRA